MTDKFIFKKGDKVKCAFYGDEVFEVDCERFYKEDSYPLCIKRYTEELYFTDDGRCNKHHTHPVLTLVERPKKKVKKTIERWINIYSEGESSWSTEKSAIDRASEDAIAVAVKLTGEYEIEVDE